jgi:ATP-dependent DNA helicase 2 subunit 1
MGEAEGPDPKPDGFHLIQLPFADDIREAKFEEACQGRSFFPGWDWRLTTAAEEKTVEAAAAWIEKLKIKNGKYNADDNPNPGKSLAGNEYEGVM